MRVFLSWSGEQSHKVALALKDWLPNVLQALDAWISSADIEKGEAWFARISDELVNSGGVGIFCLTAENLNAPWLAYEAGAIASADRGRVATFLFGVKGSSVHPPLGLFQNTDSASKDDVYKLVQMLNGRLPYPVKEAVVTRAFDMYWPSLESALSKIQSAAPPAAGKKSEKDDLLQEILAVVRRIEKDRFAPLTAGNLGIGIPAGGLLGGVGVPTAVQGPAPVFSGAIGSTAVGADAFSGSSVRLASVGMSAVNPNAPAGTL